MAGVWITACLTEFSGAARIERDNGAAGTGTSPTVSITPTSDDALVLAVEIHEHASPTTTTPSSPLYPIAEDEAPTTALAFNAAYTLQPSTGGVAVTPTWALSASRAWAALACSIAPTVADGMQEITPQRAQSAVAVDVDSLALAFPANVTAGDLLIVVGAYWALTDVLCAVTDSRSTPYTVYLGPGTLSAGGVSLTFIAQGIVPTTGACTVTVDPGGAHNVIKVAVTAIRRAHQIIPLDVDGGRETDTGSPASMTLSTVNDQTAVLGGVVTDGALEPRPIGFASLGGDADARIAHNVGLTYQNTPGPITLQWDTDSGLLRAGPTSNGSQGISSKSPKKFFGQGAVTARATIAGTLTNAPRFSGAVSAKALPITGALTINPAAKVFVGDIVATATLGVAIDLQAAHRMTSTDLTPTATLSTPTLTTSITMTALVPILSTATPNAALTIGVTLAGAGSGTATLTGALTAGAVLAGAVSASASIAGELATGAPALLEGACVASAIVRGTLQSAWKPLPGGPGRIAGVRIAPIPGAGLAPIAGTAAVTSYGGRTWEPVRGEAMAEVVGQP